MRVGKMRHAGKHATSQEGDEDYRSVAQCPAEVPPRSGPIGGYPVRILGSRKRDLTGTRTHVVLANILLQPWIESC